MKEFLRSTENLNAQLSAKETRQEERKKKLKFHARTGYECCVLCEKDRRVECIKERVKKEI
jgi:hypothetical protein